MSRSSCREWGVVALLARPADAFYCRIYCIPAQSTACNSTKRRASWHKLARQRVIGFCWQTVFVETIGCPRYVCPSTQNVCLVSTFSPQMRLCWPLCAFINYIYLLIINYKIILLYINPSHYGPFQFYAASENMAADKTKRATPAPSDRTKLGLCTLEQRRLHLDLLYCYKIVFGLVNVNFDDFFALSTNTNTKLFKPRCTASIRQKFFVDRVINVWNALPHTHTHARTHARTHTHTHTHTV